MKEAEQKLLDESKGCSDKLSALCVEHKTKTDNLEDLIRRRDFMDALPKDGTIAIDMQMPDEDAHMSGNKMHYTDSDEFPDLTEILKLRIPLDELIAETRKEIQTINKKIKVL